jgi:hypothetical protein
MLRCCIRVGNAVVAVFCSRPGAGVCSRKRPPCCERGPRIARLALQGFQTYKPTIKAAVSGVGSVLAWNNSRRRLVGRLLQRVAFRDERKAPVGS